MEETPGFDPLDGSNSQWPKASLHELLVELKIAILLESEHTSTLYALTRSSPLYHAAYIQQRSRILSMVLSLAMGSDILSGKISVQEASTIKWKDIPAPKEAVSIFLSKHGLQILSRPNF
jgi:hypothetical protein